MVGRPQMPRVFPCYAAQDRQLVRELADFLERGAGVEVLLEEGEIEPGGDLIAKVEEGLSSDVVLVLLSPESNPPRWILERWKSVFWDQAAELGTALATVLCRDSRFPDLLRRKNFIDLRQDRLAGFRAIKRWLMSLSPPPQKTPFIPARQPAFQERTAEIESLGKLVADTPGTAVLAGPPGCGKTTASLGVRPPASGRIRCGFLAHLRFPHRPVAGRRSGRPTGCPPRPRSGNQSPRTPASMLQTPLPADPRRCRRRHRRSAHPARPHFGPAHVPECRFASGPVCRAGGFEPFRSGGGTNRRRHPRSGPSCPASARRHVRLYAIGFPTRYRCPYGRCRARRGTRRRFHSNRREFVAPLDENGSRFLIPDGVRRRVALRGDAQRWTRFHARAIAALFGGQTAGTPDLTAYWPDLQYAFATALDVDWPLASTLARRAVAWAKTQDRLAEAFEILQIGIAPRSGTAIAACSKILPGNKSGSSNTGGEMWRRSSSTSSAGNATPIRWPSASISRRRSAAPSSGLPRPRAWAGRCRRATGRTDGR